MSREGELARFAAALAEARRTGASVADPAPLTLEEGYRVAALLAPSLGTVAGWKVGATSAGAQAFLGIVEPIYGRVFAHGLWPNGARVAPPGERDAEAEPEILVRLARTPGETIGRDDIAAVHVGVEVNRPSRDDALELGAPFIVADNAAHCGLVIGPEIDMAALAAPADIRVRLMRGEALHASGDAAAVLGDPLEAARWLVRTRLSSDRPVRAGDWIATGAMARSARLAVGDRLVADFGGFGEVELSR